MINKKGTGKPYPSEFLWKNELDKTMKQWYNQAMSKRKHNECVPEPAAARRFVVSLEMAKRKENEKEKKG